MEHATPTTFSLEPLGPKASSGRGMPICAACGTPTDTVPCASCGCSPLLQSRYRLERASSTGGVGLVYSAADLRRAGRPVTVRVVPLRSEHLGRVRDRLSAWLEAFRGLRDPGVRPWLDVFLVGEGARRGVGIVQRATSLPTLEGSLGHPWPTDRVVQWAVRALEAVVALHGAAVPLSCGPLTRGRVGQVADGSIQILHPGGLERFAEGVGLDVGEPPELRQGRWQPATDVHRVAGLAVQLLTGRRAAHLTDPSGTWTWTAPGGCPPELVAMLRRWLDPSPGRRPRTAADALDELIHVGIVPPELEPALSLDPIPEEVPVGVAAIRIPASLRPGLATDVPSPASLRAPARRATGERRRLAAVAGIELPDDTPDPTRRATRWVTTVVVVLMVLAALVSFQIALTATGVVSGSPIIPVDVGPAARR